MADLFNQYLLSGQTLYSQGKYADCINWFEEALKIALSNPVLNDKLPEIYTSLGSAYNYTGDSEKAKVNFDSALTIAKQTGNKSGECSGYLNISLVYRNVNNYTEALTCIDNAEKIALEIRDEKRLVETYLQYGFIYDDLGDYPKAEAYYLKIFDTILTHIFNYPLRFLSVLHKNLAGTYFALGRYEDSECYLEVAESLDQIEKNENSLAITRLGLAAIHHVRNKRNEAIEYCKESLSTLRRLGDKREAAYALLNLGIVYEEMGNRESEECFEEALKLAEDIYDLNLLRQIHLQFGNLNYFANKHLSFEHLEKSIKYHDLQRSSVINYDVSILYNFRLRYDAFELIVPLCLELDKKVEAFEYAEKSKSNAFIQLLKTTKIESKVISDKLPTLFEKERRLLEELKNHQLPSNTSNTTPESKFNTIRVKLENVYDEIEKIDSQYVHLRRGKIIKVSSLKEIAKKNDSIFIEYYIAAKDTVIIFVILAGLFEARKVKLPKSLEEYFKSFHKKVVHIEEHNSKVMWTELSNFLLEPIKNYLIDGKVIFFIPSGLLYYVPLHALTTNGKPLIEKNPIMYSTSASIIPFYYSKGSNKYETCSAFAISDRGYSFEQEAYDIARLFEAEVTIDTQKSNLNAYLKKDVLHFATHGKYFYGDAMSSSIALNKQEKLSVRDIFDLELNAELVTLSACETGIQGIGGGDELVGLTNSFVYAGAASLLVSLWVVEDDSTGELMNYFYKNLKNGMNKAISLQNAILHTMKNHSHPHYWAPFILIGKL